MNCTKGKYLSHLVALVAIAVHDRCWKKLLYIIGYRGHTSDLCPRSCLDTTSNVRFPDPFTSCLTFESLIYRGVAQRVELFPDEFGVTVDAGVDAHALRPANHLGDLALVHGT